MLLQIVVAKMLTGNQVALLMAPVTEEEIKKALFSMEEGTAQVWMAKLSIFFVNNWSPVESKFVETVPFCFQNQYM